jgi:hypothetical protein
MCVCIYAPHVLLYHMFVLTVRYYNKYAKYERTIAFTDPCCLATHMYIFVCLLKHLCMHMHRQRYFSFRLGLNDRCIYLFYFYSFKSIFFKGDTKTLFSPADTLTCCYGMNCAGSMGCDGGQPSGAWDWFTKYGKVQIYVYIYILICIYR